MSDKININPIELKKCAITFCRQTCNVYFGGYGWECSKLECDCPLFEVLKKNGIEITEEDFKDEY